MTIEEIRKEMKKKCENCIRNKSDVTKENRCLWHNLNKEEWCPYAGLWKGKVK